MKSNESFLTQATDSDCINEIKREIKQYVFALRNLFKEDSELFLKIIEKSLLIGKRLENKVYFENVRNLIEEKYPDFLKYEDGRKILKTSYSLVDKLCSKEGMSIREELDKFVISVYMLDVETEEVSLIGSDL